MSHLDLVAEGFEVVPQQAHELLVVVNNQQFGPLGVVLDFTRHLHSGLRLHMRA